MYIKALCLSLCLPVTALTALAAATAAPATDDQSMSLVSEVVAVPAPGPVEIDGRENDWDTGAGVWSYNAPDIVDEYSVWTHLMWDKQGLYYLARITDRDPLKNATKGVDFARSWQGDAVQLRTIFDDRTPDEHQMHINLYYSTPEKRAYMIVHHGGLRNTPPYDATGPGRPDLLKRFGDTMESSGGRIAMRAWNNGKGYNIEAFMPWSYLRLGGQAPKPGESFVLGWEVLWAKPSKPGETPENDQHHRLADGVKNSSANRTFMFRARSDWGRAVIGGQGNLNIAEDQRKIRQGKLAVFEDLSTHGSIPVRYRLPENRKQGEREVSIVIDNEKGERVRALFGQYPREGIEVTDLWDGLDDESKPVQPGRYTAIVVDHEPIGLELFSTLYNAGTPPWATDKENLFWGSDHGAAAGVSTFGDRVVVSFTLPEGGMGLNSYRLGAAGGGEGEGGRIEWGTRNSAADIVATKDFIYSFEYNFWVGRFLVSRLDPETGRVVPFIQDDGSQIISFDITMEIAKRLSGESTMEKDKQITNLVNRASLAFDGRSLWLLSADETLYKINPRTGALQEKRSASGEGLAGIRSRNGKVYGVYKDKSLWSLDAGLGKGKKLRELDRVREIGRIGISQDEKRVAVTDLATNQVFVFALDNSGNNNREAISVIGKPTPGTDRAGGPFDRNDIMCPVGVDFDKEGRLWVAEGTFAIHRVSVWDKEGAFADEFWGSAPYGSTHSYALPHDASRFIAMRTEFEMDRAIDPHKRKSAEKPLFYHPQLKGTQGVVNRVTGKDGRVHEFAVGPGGGDQRAIVIYRRDARGEFVPAAALFPPVDNPSRRFRTPFSEWIPDSKSPSAWVDRNGNARLDPGEHITQGVRFAPLYMGAGWVRPDMTILTADMMTYPLLDIDEYGVPQYDFGKPVPASNPVKTEDRQGSTGTPVMDRAGNITNGIAFHMIDGRRGRYPNRYGRHDAPAAQRGVLIAPFRTNGVVEDISGIGSATMLQGDRGQWFLMSFDGIFISALFQDAKGIVTMNETFIGGESFGGQFWRVTDGPMKGRVLLQTGGIGYLLFEVKNLETIRRQTVPLNVTAEDIARGQTIAAARKSASHKEGPLVISRTARLPQSAPSPDLPREAALAEGLLFTLVVQEGDKERWFKVSLLTDGKDLAALWQVADNSPWRNGADRFTHAFIGGDAVDLKLLSPQKGPVRLLAAPLDGKPRAIFWQQKAESAARENPQTYVVANNPANARAFDIVRQLASARIDTKTSGNGYTVLVRVPLSELGLDGAALSSGLKGVAGVIYSDTSGNNRVARLYWHDKNTGMVNDVPTEAAVAPETFGEILIKN
jgi:hypothetical protein